MRGRQQQMQRQMQVQMQNGQHMQQEQGWAVGAGLAMLPTASNHCSLHTFARQSL